MLIQLLMIKIKTFLITFFLIFNYCYILPTDAFNLEKGKTLFIKNCIACHKNGTNVIIPEKNLKQLTLEANGIYSKDAIIYEILNGKNGMPAFGGRLKEEEIETIATYIIDAASREF